MKKASKKKSVDVAAVELLTSAADFAKTYMPANTKKDGYISLEDHQKIIDFYVNCAAGMLTVAMDATVRIIVRSELDSEIKLRLGSFFTNKN